MREDTTYLSSWKSETIRTYKFSSSYKTLNFVWSGALIESSGKYCQNSEVNFAFFHADSSPTPSTFISESMKTALADCPKATFDISNISGRRSFLISLILVANIVILVINNITLD